MERLKFGRWFKWRTLVSLLVAVAGASLFGAAPRGVLVILADDLGIGDVGAYGATHVRTPALDRLAAEGLRLTDFHVPAAQCTPARAALLTGFYPERIGMERVLFPGQEKGIPDACVTLAELLRDRGYRTHAVGKWHLGDGGTALPTHQGFETYWGIPYSHDMKPMVILDGEAVVERDVPAGELTARWTQRAVATLRGLGVDERFFLYLAHTAPHVPLGASPEFQGRSAFGAYGDTVEELDAAVGQVLSTLEELGRRDDTLVIFVSDNGPFQPWGRPDPHIGGFAWPYRGAKAAAREGGLRVPCLIRWPGVLPAGEVRDGLATMMDVWPTLEGLTRDVKSEVASGHVDGEDLWPGLVDASAWQHGPVAFFHYGRLEAIREGPWKLMLPRRREWDLPFAFRSNRARAEREFGPGQEVLPQVLTHLERDPGEVLDFTAEAPGMVQRLERLADQFRKDLGDRRESLP